MKFTRTLIGSALLFLASTASASIIDNGDYTTVDGIDWLDWTLTTGLTQSAALTNNAGWRTATLAEMELLMNAMFNTTFVYNASGYDTALGSVAGVANSKVTFGALFGYTSGSNTYASAEGIGLVGFDSFAYAGLGRPGGYDYYYNNEDYSDYWNGVALVRNGVVPEPSILALMGLGIFGLGLSRRKMKK